MFFAPLLKIERRIEDDILTMSGTTHSTDPAWFYLVLKW